MMTEARLPCRNPLPSFCVIHQTMKFTTLLSLLALTSSLLAQTEPNNPPAAPVAAPQLAPNQQAFLNLPEESRNEFRKCMMEASRLFAQKRIFETVDQLDKAEKIFADAPEVHSLRANCYVETRAFDKALEYYAKAKALSPDDRSIDFNTAEIFFVTKQWKKCVEMFEEILPQIPPARIGMARLVEFKIFLCKQKLGLKAEAKALAEKYTDEDDSPYYYYARAAEAYEKNDLAKAEEWLAICTRIFREPSTIAPWQDTFVEYGYIKSFYGDDQVAK